MADLAHVRHFNSASQIINQEALFGPQVTATLKALGSNEKYDSVRKTPVSPQSVVASSNAACEVGASWDTVLWGVLMVLGFFFFLRLGEVAALLWTDVVLVNRGVQITIRRQKTRSQLQPIPVVRFCAAPILVRVVTRALSFRDRCQGPVWPATGGLLREALVRHLGLPPILSGETRPLPWSWRAGGATACFNAGISVARIQRIGRWASETALMYCCMTPLAQSRLYDGLADEAWYPEN